jgi:hypothetical protein
MRTGGEDEFQRDNFAAILTEQAVFMAWNLVLATENR